MIPFTEAERAHYLDTYLCVHCLDVARRNEDGYPVEMSGSEVTHLVCLPLNSYIDAILEEFVDMKRRSFVLPVCDDCYKEWQSIWQEEVQQASPPKPDGNICAMVRFVGPVCEAYPDPVVYKNKNKAK